MQVRWLRTALRNLDEEATCIAADDPQAAQRVVERVLNAVEMLTSHPALGRPGRVPGTRELVVAHTRYLVPYRVRGQVVEILRVFHTPRRPPQHCWEPVGRAGSLRGRGALDDRSRGQPRPGGFSGSPFVWWLTPRASGRRCWQRPGAGARTPR